MRRESVVVKPLSDEELREWLEGYPPAAEALADLRANKIDLEADPEFVADCAKGDYVGDIYRAMERTGINKNALAQKLGKSRQYVGRVINETANFTIESMAEMACALGMRLVVRMAFRDERVMIEPRAEAAPAAKRAGSAQKAKSAALRKKAAKAQPSRKPAAPARRAKVSRVRSDGKAVRR